MVRSYLSLSLSNARQRDGQDRLPVFQHRIAPPPRDSVRYDALSRLADREESEPRFVINLAFKRDRHNRRERVREEMKAFFGAVSPGRTLFMDREEAKE